MGKEKKLLGVEKRSFVEDAVPKDYVLKRRGNLRDTVVMAKHLSMEWDDF